MTDVTSEQTTTKPYYDVLDGLRGIAAFIILVFHYFEIIYFDDYETNPLGHGYLAVDFFFCLSGFVIAFAYDNRIKTLGVKRFFINRLIRLHPMVIFGTFIGFLVYVFDPFIGNPLASGWGYILLAFIMSLLMLPCPFLEHRGGGICPFDTPMWSLFFEYIANIFYAYVLCRLKKLPLLIFGIGSALWLGYCASQSGWIINGWAIDGFSDGFVRVFCSFTAGMLVYRFSWEIKTPLNFWLPALMLLGVFFYPHITNDWLAETIIIVVVFPTIMAFGAGAVATGFIKKICLFIGRLSYPLYLTHIATVWPYTSYFIKYKPSPTDPKLILLTIGLIIFNLLFAYAVMRLYDEPVRRWLTNKYKLWLHRREAE
jgi:peptidoglycan/LPS O-acetylase OafA/YrhL